MPKKSLIEINVSGVVKIVKNGITAPMLMTSLQDAKNIAPKKKKNSRFLLLGNSFHRLDRSCRYKISPVKVEYRYVYFHTHSLSHKRHD